MEDDSPDCPDSNTTTQLTLSVGQCDQMWWSRISRRGNILWWDWCQKQPDITVNLRLTIFPKTENTLSHWWHEPDMPPYCSLDCATNAINYSPWEVAKKIQMNLRSRSCSQEYKFENRNFSLNWELEPSLNMLTFMSGHFKWLKMYCMKTYTLCVTPVCWLRSYGRILRKINLKNNLIAIALV